MEQQNLVYIALGSNIGDRFKNLQQGVNLIFQELGKINSVARVYNTPAIGFAKDSNPDDFLNTCIAVETHLPVEKVLKTLQAIEKKLGRNTSKSNSKTSGYQSRTIDLDILFYNDAVIETAELKIPHPFLHERKFVLQPLNNIATNKLHPILKQDVSTLLKQCVDKSPVEPLNIWLKNPMKKFDFPSFNFLAFEGNIGAGKTSLAKRIANDFNAKLILERFADNPFLPKFYDDQKRYAFTLEMSFLADRYQQISDDLSQLDLFKDFMVSDYDIFKSLIFSKITLSEDEFKLYRKLFYLMYKDMAKPDLYIYLYQNTSRLQENIKKRGRDYEQHIDDDYLERINSGYLDFLKNQTELNAKIIDISNRDFVENRKDYLWILNQIG